MASDENNFEVFRDTLAGVLVWKSNQDSKKRAKKSSRRNRKATVNSSAERESPTNNDAEELAEFVEYLANEIFDSLPEELKTISYSQVFADPALQQRYSETDIYEELSEQIPESVSITLETYSFPELRNILSLTLPPYLATLTAEPPLWVTTRASACELCQRDWIPLTYHHLIPRSTHDRAVKKGWCEEWEINKVAWLCSACHRAVHRNVTNEELAEKYDTVDKLLEREDIQKFVAWVGSIRWKKR